MDMLKEPKSRKTDSLVSFKEDSQPKSIQVNTLNLPLLDDPEDLLIRHSASFERELQDFEEQERSKRD